MVITDENSHSKIKGESYKRNKIISLFFQPQSPVNFAGLLHSFEM